VQNDEQQASPHVGIEIEVMSRRAIAILQRANYLAAMCV
jgi:hypothetical protein